MENQVIVEEGKQEEVKLNFSNVFAFLSSLDYLRFLELEGAFEGIKSRELYYSYERIALAGFVLKHVVSAMTGVYFLVLFAGHFLFNVSPLTLAILIAFSYTLLGFFLVERYTLGNGYLYVIFRDFLLNALVFTFFVWILSDTLLFYVLPKAWEGFINWFFTKGEGNLNEFFYQVLYDVISLLSPVVLKLIEIAKPYVELYTLIAPVKAFSLLAIWAYFIYLSKTRRDTLKWKLKRFKRLA